jgi:outer membrane protein
MRSKFLHARRAHASVAALLALAGLCLPGGFDAAAAETLKQALGSAYRYNPRLDAARATLRATDEEVARANSGYRPTINGTADVGYLNTETKPGSAASGETHPRGYAVTASQPVFRGFRTLNQVREAEATVRAGRETLRVVEQLVLLDAVTAYMDVLRDTNILRIRENNVSVLTRELKATQERFAVGEVTRTDVAQAEARRAAAISALDLARSNLKTSRGAYERHIGRPPTSLVEPNASERRLPRSLEEAISISARENPNVVVSLYREQASRHTVDRIWGELLPSFQVDASYGRRFDSSLTTDQSESTSVTGRLTVPFYTSGEVQARVRQAKHTHVARIQEIEQARADVQAVVVQSWSQLAAARAQLDSDNASVKAFRTALAGVREEEKVGQRTLLDILNAEQELLNAEVNLISTKRNIIVATYNVLAAIGRLNIQELGAAGSVYDPELHYFEIRRKWWGVSITHADGRTDAHDLWETVGRVFHRGEEPASPGKWATDVAAEPRPVAAKTVGPRK